MYARNRRIVTAVHLSHLKLQLIAKKRHAVSEGFDTFTQWQHWRVATRMTVVKQDWVPGRIRALQARSHLPGVQRITVLVAVPRNDHRCGIICAVTYLVIW